MKTLLLEGAIFFAFIALNLIYYKQVLAFFRTIYKKFERRNVNEHGVECPVPLRFWPEGYDYMVLDKRNTFYRAYFFNREPQLWTEEDGQQYWIAEYPYEIKSFKDFEVERFMKIPLDFLKWKR